jgi:hypothetical protein
MSDLREWVRNNRPIIGSSLGDYCKKNGFFVLVPLVDKMDMIGEFYLVELTMFKGQYVFVPFGCGHLARLYTDRYKRGIILRPKKKKHQNLASDVIEDIIDIWNSI